MLNSVIANNRGFFGQPRDVNIADINGQKLFNWIGGRDGDPRLGPLKDNGGPTLTMMPRPGSPLIDGGISMGDIFVDQRGFARRVDGDDIVPLPFLDRRTSDIGAVEFNPGVNIPIVTASGFGDGTVKVYDAATEELFREFQPYPGFLGGITVASGDVNRDGVLDVITAPSQGGGPHVKAFSGVDGTELFNFFAYNPLFFGGVNLASGDINGDGFDDIITSPNFGGGPHVRVFSGADPSEVLGEFLAYQNTFTGGVRVAVGDINGDDTPDIVTGPGLGSAPLVRIFDGNSFTQIDEFLAYSQAFQGGVFVAVENITGSKADIITAPARGGGPHIRVFEGDTQELITVFFAYHPNFTGGVRVAAGDFDGDGSPEILTAAGPGGGPHVRQFDALTGEQEFSAFSSFFPFDIGFSGGVFAAGGLDLPAPDENALLAAEEPVLESTGNELSQVDLNSLADAAISQFAVMPNGAEITARLSSVTFTIADLPGRQLGASVGGVILIDQTAAGRGWFVDATLFFLTRTVLIGRRD